MKILIIHNQYKIFGGEDSVVEEELQLLRKRGHQVDTFFVSNKTIGENIFSKALVALGSIFSLRTYFDVKRKINILKPDVIHVHNFYPIISPSVFYAAFSKKTPVVMTLHNFRLFCPTAILLHSGKISHQSLIEGPWWAVKEKVYQDSYLATFFLVLMIFTHSKLNTWNRKVDKFAVLSNFSRKLFIEYGIEEKKLITKYNFISCHEKLKRYADRLSDQKKYALYVGRLEEEKGINTLLEAWSDIEFDLKIVGEGSLKSKILENKSERVFYLGQLPRPKVMEQMQGAALLIFPSLWYENCPMVLLEALSIGLPVIASNIGAMPEIIKNFETGVLFSPGDAKELSKNVNALLTDYETLNMLSINARSDFEARFSEDVAGKELEKLYLSAIRDD